MSTPLAKYMGKTHSPADDRLEELQEERTEVNEDINFWEMVREAHDQENSPHRDRVVIQSCGKYLATYCWEINPLNGWVTVGIKEDGGGQSTMPTCPGDWCLLAQAVDYFGIDRSEIQFTDKASDYYKEDVKK